MRSSAAGSASLLRAGLALGLVWLSILPCEAQISGTVSVTSDERWRGRSLSAGHPAATAGISYDDASGFYLDAAATGALSGDSVSLIGIAADAGYAWRLPSGTALDIGVHRRQLTRYSSSGRSTGYTELYAGVSGRSLSARIHYSPDYFRRKANVLYASLDGVLRPATNWRLLAHAGAASYLDGRPVPQVRPVQYDYSLGVARQQGAVELRLLWATGGPDRDYFSGRPRSKSALVLSASLGF
jgi:uncharacterized protein (TIGR02001 family)